MTAKNFTSPAGWFSLTLPATWDTYECDEEGTSAFFESQSPEWIGNLRITPFRITKPQGAEDGVFRFLTQKQKEYEGSERLTIGTFDGVHYRENLQEEEEELIVYHWLLGHQNTLFFCSLTIAQTQENTPKNQEVLAAVHQIMESLRVH